MNLIWKLLRQHISLSQFAGFFFANLFGMWVVMLGIQFYKDIIPVFTEEDSFINNNFLVVSKHITTVGTLSGRNNAFSTYDIDDVGKQPFCKKVGAFTSSQYKVSAAMSVQGAEPLNTEMFLKLYPIALSTHQPRIGNTLLAAKRYLLYCLVPISLFITLDLPKAVTYLK